MWALVGLIVEAVGAAVQYNASQNQAQQADRVARYNLQAARNQAAQERANREAVERAERRALAARRSEIEAAYARGGVLTGEGTPAAMLVEQARVDEWNTLSGRAASEAQARSALAAGRLAAMEGRGLAIGYRAQGTSALVRGIGGGLVQYRRDKRQQQSWLNG